MDPLHLGMGWTEEELEMPQILIESTYGQSHPGSAHLDCLAHAAEKGVAENGGKAGTRRHELLSGKQGHDCKHD